MKKKLSSVIASEAKQSFKRDCFVASLLAMTLFFLPVVARANGIAVSGVSFGTQNTTSHYMPITFNLTWSNAWRDSVNNDAAWVFIKYSFDGGVTWNHATLGPVAGGTTISDGGTGGVSNPTNFSGGTVNVTSTGSTSVPLDVIIPTEATSGYKGAFVQITSLSNISGSPSSVSGAITSLSTPVPVQLLWNYSTDLSATYPSTYDNLAATAIVQVMAIEMVYVPTGSFYIGDGSPSPEGNFQLVSSVNTPVQITTSTTAAVNGSSTSNSYDDTYMLAGAGSPGNGAGITITGPTGIACSGGAACIGASFTSNTSFPTGYNAFYMMKYDISQVQYRDFLNTLTRNQQNNRVADSLSGLTSLPTYVYVSSQDASPAYSVSSYRNGLVVTAISSSTASVTFGCQLSGAVNGSSDGEWVAMNYLSWMDGAAYAAWAGLRPYTELEYEKAARGPSSADTGVSGEYAWGNATITQATSISNSGLNSEVAGQTGIGLCAYGGAAGVQGPMRCGFAATSGTSRTGAGASYWGILDLSGNLWKRPVTVGNSTGRAFIGTNGTGLLASDGNATNSDWPGYSSGEVSGATGCGLRGGSWSYGSTNERVSDRYFAAFVLTSRTAYYGARFARTSP